MKAAVLLGALALSACATTGTRPEPIVIRSPAVEVPVAVRCKPKPVAQPAYPDTDAALRTAPTLFARVQALLAGRDIRSAENDQLRAALKGCAGG